MKDTAKALQTMLQVNNVTMQEQAQKMANLTIQNQELQSQLESITTQLANLQNTL